MENRVAVPQLASITSDQARQLTDRIKVAVDGTWLLIQEAYTSRAWAALGYGSWDDYCTREFGTSRLRLPREERQEVVASLREIGMSVRAIAAATGNGVGSVHRALAAVPNGTPERVRTPELDDAFRENGTDPDQLDDDTYAAITRPTAGDYGPVPDPRTVTGTDGKSYPATPTRTPPRPALPPQFQSAVNAVTQAVGRIEKLQTDDRYRANRAAIASLCLPEVRRAASVLHDLLSDLGHGNGGPQ
jgi:hypothetical protein